MPILLLTRPLNEVYIFFAVWFFELRIYPNNDAQFKYYIQKWLEVALISLWNDIKLTCNLVLVFICFQFLGNASPHCPSLLLI